MASPTETPAGPADASGPAGAEPAPDVGKAAGDRPVGRQAGIDGLGERAWRELIALDDRLHNERNIRLLTPEARVLIYLKLAGPVPVTAAMQVAGTSYRGFYAVVERLKQAGIVATVKDDQDQRVRRLSIDPSETMSTAER